MPKFRVRIWDPMDGLRRTPAIVVANVLGSDTADVIDAEEDEVIQHVFAKGPVKSLDLGIGVGCPVRSRQASNIHDVGEPAIEAAAMAFRSGAGLGISELPEDPIVVVQEKARLAVESRDTADLVFDPRKRRVVGDFDVDDAPRFELHDDEHVEDCEKGSVLGHEVAGEDLSSVILDEGSPGLWIESRASFGHIPSDRTG